MAKSVIQKIVFIFFVFIYGLWTIDCGAPLYAQKKEGWQAAKSAHFVVYYQNASQDFVRRAIDKLEGYYDKIAQGLGFRRFDFWLWENRARLYIYDIAEDYQADTGQPGWSVGCAFVSRKIIKTYLGAEGFFENVLPHEMGHIIFREFVGFSNPAVAAWLDEGVASYQEESRKALSRSVVKQAAQDGGFIGLEELGGLDPQELEGREKVNIFYAEAVGVISYLIERFGRDNFLAFCQKLRDTQELERAIRSSYPFRNLGDLEEAWLKALGV